MNKPNIDLKKQTNPLLDGLPDYLKDPANFEEIQKKILDTIITSCTHSELLDFANCPICTKKMLERRKLLKKLGFKYPAQYMAWKKTHLKIKELYPLLDWKTRKQINH